VEKKATQNLGPGKYNLWSGLAFGMDMSCAGDDVPKQPMIQGKKATNKNLPHVVPEGWIAVNSGVMYRLKLVPMEKKKKRSEECRGCGGPPEDIPWIAVMAKDGESGAYERGRKASRHRLREKPPIKMAPLEEAAAGAFARRRDRKTDKIRSSQGFFGMQGEFLFRARPRTNCGDRSLQS